MKKKVRQTFEPNGSGQTYHKKKKDRRSGHHFVDFYNSSLSYGRKKRSRIRYLNWATELYGCLDEEMEKKGVTELCDESNHQVCDEQTNQRVREAVGKLSPLERQFVECFYFQYKSYKEISRILNKKTHKLERIHNRALSKLKILLSDYVKTRFKLSVPEETDCMICKSPFRQELDKLIKAKEEKETYKRLMRVFKEKYGLNIKTPQVIIGHKKKHMI
jgi:RNA polymerase sigma factor (sigma-70 family)